jgi:hypothetical protein
MTSPQDLPRNANAKASRQRTIIVFIGVSSILAHWRAGEKTIGRCQHPE